MANTNAIHKYGWIPDHPDFRDLIFNSQNVVQSETIDLRPLCPQIWDQGLLNSCTANAAGSNFEFLQKKEKLLDFMPSRLFIYYNTRLIEGTTSYDAGASNRNTIKSIVNYGVCDEIMWAYNIYMYNFKPTKNAYASAIKHKSTQYLKIPINLTQMKACLHDGYPFICGISVYSSFESDLVTTTGKVPLPKSNENILGGHAMLVVGFDDKTQNFIIRNSWGKNWGDKGYCYIPYGYLANPSLPADFWTLRYVT